MFSTNNNQWEVTKYGVLIEESKINITGLSKIVTKLWKYEDHFYIELWDNDINVYFNEVID